MVVWLVKDVLGTLRVDPERVYLTGMSMGGYGTWETAAKYPELFAAIVPICGRGDPAAAWKLRHIPTWIFHGAKDTVVPIKHSDDMNEALQQYGNVKYTIYPEADHDSWTETYSMRSSTGGSSATGGSATERPPHPRTERGSSGDTPRRRTQPRSTSRRGDCTSL